MNALTVKEISIKIETLKHALKYARDFQEQASIQYEINRLENLKAQ